MYIFKALFVAAIVISVSFVIAAPSLDEVKPTTTETTTIGFRFDPRKVVLKTRRSDDGSTEISINIKNPDRTKPLCDFYPEEDFSLQEKQLQRYGRRIGGCELIGACALVFAHWRFPRFNQSSAFRTLKGYFSNAVIATPARFLPFTVGLFTDPSYLNPLVPYRQSRALRVVRENAISKRAYVTIEDDPDRFLKDLKKALGKDNKSGRVVEVEPKE